MRFDDIYLRGLGMWLPPVMTAEKALELGFTDRSLISRTGASAVCVAGTESAPEMAVNAARIAMERGGCGTGEICLLLHSSVYFQGHDLWPAASYIQRMTVNNRCPAMEVGHTSNSGMVALELAAAYLTASGGAAVLLTTGDRFVAPGVDRWRTDPGTVFGDGATAAVVSQAPGFARVLSVVTVADPELEEMHRGTDPFTAAPLELRVPVDIEAPTREFLRGPSGADINRRMAAGHRSVMTQALEEAEVPASSVSWYVLPNTGRRRLEVGFFRRLGIDPQASTWAWGQGVGHLGAGDQFAGLTHLVDTGQLRRGQYCLLLGVGGGFTWSCAVVEIVETPQWTVKDGR
ncbi:ketoacyl-ACP synthase III family protein [Streptomyces sp. NPDC001139]